MRSFDHLVQQLTGLYINWLKKDPYQVHEAQSFKNSRKKNRWFDSWIKSS